MKRIILFFGVLVSIAPYTMLSKPQHRLPHNTANASAIAKQLFDSLENAQSNSFKTTLDGVFQKFGNNRPLLKKIFSERNQHGLTLLMQLVLYGDIENIIYLLDRLKGYFGSETDILYNYINAREPKRGRTALLMSTYNRNVKLFRTLLEKFDVLVDRDPEYLYQILNAHDDIYHLTPLISVAYESSISNVENIVKKAKARFGNNKELFNNFINAENGIGLTALDLAISPNVYHYLAKNGAKKGTPQKKDIPFLHEALVTGKQLVNAVENNNYKHAQQLINHALKTYNTKAFFAFISRRNRGWNAIMNAAADNKPEMITLLVKAMDQGLAQDRELIFDVLNTVDTNGMTALHLALSRQNMELASTLLKIVYDAAGNANNFFRFINTPDELNGYTPLIQVAYLSREIDEPAYQFIRLLLRLAQHYLDHHKSFYLFLNARDYNNQTALDYVREPRIAALLKEQGAVE